MMEPLTQDAPIGIAPFLVQKGQQRTKEELYILSLKGTAESIKQGLCVDLTLSQKRLQVILNNS